MFISRRKKASADRGVSGHARRRARVEAAEAAELCAVEAEDARKPAVLEQQPEQAPASSQTAGSQAVLVCGCTERRAHTFVRSRRR